MLSKTLELRAQQMDFGRGIAFLLQRYDGGRRSVGTAITLQAVDEVQAIEPAFELSPANARLLMDDLWRVGIRPSNGEGSVGQLAATEKHLADMRKLTDRLLDEVLRPPEVRIERAPG